MSNKEEKKTCFFDVCCQCKTVCCREAKPPLTPRRKKIIEDYLEEQKIPAENSLVHEAYSFPALDAMGFCVFYNKETRKCLVHPVKPETCRAGPVTFDINRRTRKIEWYLKTAEICALAGRLYENKNLFRQYFKAAKEELLQLVRELDSEALKAILRIEEPQTFKIDEDDLPEGLAEKLKLA